MHSSVHHHDHRNDNVRPLLGLIALLGLMLGLIVIIQALAAGS